MATDFLSTNGINQEEIPKVYYDMLSELNYSMRPRDLVPSLLDFGTIPTFSLNFRIISKQKERIEMVRTARDEVV